VESEHIERTLASVSAVNFLFIRGIFRREI
jgi:hypothetical protein